MEPPLKSLGDLHVDAIFSSFGGGILIFNKRGYVAYENELARKLMGGKELLKEEASFFAADRKTPIEKTRLPFERAAHGETVDPDIYFVRNTLHPEGLFIQMSAGPILVEKKQIGSVIFFFDVTKTYEAEALKTDFVSFASHQLRTPLTGIRWATAGLRKCGGMNPPVISYINDIEYAADHLIELTEVFLDVSRLEKARWSGVFEQFVFQQEVHAVRDVLAATAERKRVHLSWHIPENAVQLFSDRRAIRTIINSIITNAIDYTPPDGHVVVEISTEGQSVRIVVKDSGIGIPEADQPRIFERFFRASNATSTKVEGTGLGLYIVKELLSQLGGTISFSSKKGETMFTVTLPLRAVKNGKRDRSSQRRR